jgi:hypothetical protein
MESVERVRDRQTVKDILANTAEDQEDTLSQP